MASNISLPDPSSKPTTNTQDGKKDAIGSNGDIKIKGVLNISKILEPDLKNDDEYQYNISNFLRKCLEKPNDWISKANSFTKALDRKVHVSASDLKYKQIYQETNIIIERFCDILKNDARFKAASLRRTGSIRADVKVGLPHETDYLLQLKHLDVFKDEPIEKLDSSNDVSSLEEAAQSQLIRRIMLLTKEESHRAMNIKYRLRKDSGFAEEHTKDVEWYEQYIKDSHFHRIVYNILSSNTGQLDKLLDGFNHWEILDIKELQKTRGLCFTMTCKTGEAKGDVVGVTVDLIPVCVLTSCDVIVGEFTEQALSMVPFDLDEYIKRGDVYRLINRQDIDTGIIENDLLKQLPEGVKRGFRITKFLVNTIFRDVTPVNKIEDADIFGYTARIRSYTIRRILFHIVMQCHKTDSFTELTDGVLAMLILDMYRDLRMSGRFISDPIICYDGGVIMRPIDFSNTPQINCDSNGVLCSLLKSFAVEYPYDNIDNFGLLNSQNTDANLISYWEWHCNGK